MVIFRQGGYVFWKCTICCLLVVTLLHAALPRKAAPITRSEILVQLDFGDGNGRVTDLIEQHGIGFTPGRRFLSLLKTQGANKGLLAAIENAKPPAAPVLSDNAFYSQLVCCFQLARNKSFAAVKQACRTAIAARTLSVLTLAAAQPPDSKAPADGTLQYFETLAARLKKLKPGNFQLLKSKAQSGNPEAQVMLCLAYTRGFGAMQDFTHAMEWCQKAAAQGSVPGEIGVGLAYLSGRGVAKDASQARLWFQKAAAQNATYAMNLLGTIYANAIGVPQNYGKAMAWYRQAANLDDPKSDMDIGVMYFQGQGVKPDSKKGLRWLQKAVELRFPFAEFTLAQMYQRGMVVRRDDLLALALFHRAAKQGFVPAETELGWIYANGVGMPVNYSKAIMWYQKAAVQGDAKAAYGLGVRYMIGQGVSRDYSAAEKWFLVAAKEGEGDAQYNLALLFLNMMPEESAQPDPVRAARYARMAADENVADAQALLGLLYADGRGVPKDKVAACMWLLLGEKGGNRGSARALRGLEKEMSHEQIVVAKASAAAWRPHIFPHQIPMP